MSQIYLLPKLRNNRTGVTLKTQDLTGARFPNTKQGRKLAEDYADQYAEKMTARTEDPWTGFVVEYTAGVNSL